jgi:hypothetical protein
VAALCAKLELAAVLVVVADDPLTSWLTTETAMLEELVQASPARMVALLLKVISAHWSRRQQDCIVRVQLHGQRFQ